MQLIIFIVSLLLFISYAGLLIYYRRGWLSITPGGNEKALTIKELSNVNTAAIRVSVIISARNEEQNIQACLKSVCAQSYPKTLYEIIVVDDHSTDRTAEIILSFSAQNVRLLLLKNFTGGNKLNAYKKKAIEVAVQQSTGDLIVTTDADCIVPNLWLQTLVSFYQNNNAVFIAAPVAYLPSPGSERLGLRLLTIFQSIDFMTLQGITGAAVYKKIHSMCNGANLAYEKKAFYEVGGFKGIDNIASGDDMLLMHKIFKRYKERVFFLQSTDAIVQTQAQPTLKDFLNQRIRWASKAVKYDDKRIFAVLLLVYFFNAWIAVLVIATLFNRSIGFLLLALVANKTIIELYFLYPVAVFFNRQKLLWWFPLAQPFHIMYTIISGWLGRFGSFQWKERKVK